MLIARILPNIKDVTSVFNPLVKDVTNIPSASELEEINAIEASPFKFVEELTFNKRNAAKMQTGIETASGAQLNAIAIAIVPKATWLNPSPIIENLFKTRIIPKSAAHKLISVPAIIERTIKPYEKSSVKKLIIFVRSCYVNVASIAICTTAVEDLLFSY